MSFVGTNIMKAVMTTPVVTMATNQLRSTAIKFATDWFMRNGMQIIKSEVMVTLKMGQQDSRAYHEFLVWLNKKINTKSRFFVGSAMENDLYNLTNVPVFFRYDGHLFYAFRQTYIKKDDYASMAAGSTIVVNMIGRNPDIMKKLFEEVKKKNNVSDENEGPYDIEIYRSQYGGSWQHVCEVAPRALESVILRKDIKDSIMKKINDWIASENFYKSRGLSYKLGLILKGYPGTGKTSIIKAIASHLGYDLYLLNLKHVTDMNISECLQRTGTNSIIVIEEFDACGATGRRTGLGTELDIIDPQDDEENAIVSIMKKAGVIVPTDKKEDGGTLTLAGLLTALDGLIPLNNKIIVMTTNIMDETKFDPALMRKGRIDGIFEIPYMEQTEIEEYIKYMYPGNELPEGIVFQPTAGCDLQDAFLDNKYDFEGFVQDVLQIHEKKTISATTEEITKDVAMISQETEEVIKDVVMISQETE